ncbi:Vacuolar protein sorting-associated protein 25 [Smittium culicis]|uniref:Vacuolar protein sorting-associated protein 25 n=1 Tax=Smittium culicis TaxID=133412 RepID=A0A1R1YTH2_9FUNG|nr:Vacuolar protein sorting-associated protein 25 [Smittium culicis]
MIKQGLAEWDPAAEKKTKFYIFWKKPSEWAEIIYSFIIERGLINTILTAYELVDSSGLAFGTEFSELDSYVLNKAIKLLKSQGKVTSFKSSDSSSIGIKFIIP